MADPWWRLRSQPAASEYLNDQVYDDDGKPTLVLVVVRRDELTGEPVEWVYAQPDAADGWNADKWSSDSRG